MDSDLVVLGAGPAGLAAAWRAARNGLSVRVLERADHVGGLSSTEHVAGVAVDPGSRRLSAATAPNILADLREILGPDLQLRRRQGRLRVCGSWVRFPLRAPELLRAMPPRLLTGLATDMALGPLRRMARREDTYAAALRAGLGPTLYEELYAPFALKLWGLPGDRISGHQARKRVSADTPGKVLSRILRPSHATGSREYYYPRRGFGQLSEALADAARSAGATIETAAEVDWLTLRPEGVQIATVDGDQHRASHVFSTLPLPGLVRMVSPGAPGHVVEAASRLRFRGMVLVYLVHGRGRWTPYDAHYIPGDGTRISRISEPANFRDNVDDPTDRSVICVELPATAGDPIWASDDADIVAQVTARIAALGLPPVDLRGSAVRRVPHVYPVYTLGYRQDLDELERWALKLPSLTSFGRLGLFAHDNTHHALAEAYAAADALGSGRWDAEAWRKARAGFAELVVED